MTRRLGVAISTVVVAFATSLMPLGPGTASGAPTVACGQALSDNEVRRITELSDTADQHESTPLARLDGAIADLRSITEILTDHGDRRGLFAVGLYSVERDAVTPLQHRENAFEHPRWAPVISLALLNRFLDALHAEFTGETVPPQWQRYFDLTRDCSASPARTAMVGYNAHLTVDLAYAIADARTAPAQARDYFTIVDTIAVHGDSIVNDTTAAYGPAADLGPLFRFYFVGEGLDRLVGAGVATDPMLRAADIGYNVLTFTNGLNLQNPATAPGARNNITALWLTADEAFIALTELDLL